MMNYIWGFMIILGVFFAIINNKVSAFTEGLMVSCTEAVEFIIALAGIMAVWSGLMKIAEESGLVSKLSNLTRPLIKYLFPEIKNPQITATMLMSFMANIFGAGNSATVFSLKTMTLLDNENNKSPVASNAMCMFIALSMSMIQLLPITIIKIRSDMGSASPEDIILPSILAGLFSMVVSVLVCKLAERN